MNKHSPHLNSMLPITSPIKTLRIEHHANVGNNTTRSSTRRERSTSTRSSSCFFADDEHSVDDDDDECSTIHSDTSSYHHRFAVRFNSRVQIQEIEHLKDMSDAQITDIWFRVVDYKRIRAELKYFIEMRQNGGDSFEIQEANDSFRGLECQTKEAIKRKRERRKKSIDTVLEEQAAQKAARNTTDAPTTLSSSFSSHHQQEEEQIARRYREATKFSRQQAHMLGLKDAEATMGKFQKRRRWMEPAWEDRKESTFVVGGVAVLCSTAAYHSDGIQFPKKISSLPFSRSRPRSSSFELVRPC